MKNDKIHDTCSILSDPSDERIVLELRYDEDEMYRWYTRSGEDTEVSGRTLLEAQTAASAAWGAEAWGLEAHWR